MLQTRTEATVASFRKVLYFPIKKSVFGSSLGFIIHEVVIPPVAADQLCSQRLSGGKVSGDLADVNARFVSGPLLNGSLKTITRSKSELGRKTRRVNEAWDNRKD